MKNIIKTSLMAAAISFAGIWTLNAAEIGQPAPAWTLTDSNGTTHNLADFKGKFVVLEWINYDCPFVKKFYEKSGEMPKLQKEYREKGVVWLAICSSAPGTQGHFATDALNARSEKEGFAGDAYLVDESGTVGKAYGARTTPHMYVINPEGVLVYNGAIDSIRSTGADDITKADNYVRAALDAAMAGNPVETATTTAYGCSVKYKN